MSPSALACVSYPSVGRNLPDNGRPIAIIRKVGSHLVLEAGGYPIRAGNEHNARTLRDYAEAFGYEVVDVFQG